MALGLRVLCGRARRSVWDEWAAAGDLWGYAPLVRTTFSRDVARIFSAREHCGHGWLLVGGIVGSGGDALLFAVPACVVAGNLAGQSGESSYAWREFSSICLFRIDGHCRAA